MCSFFAELKNLAAESLELLEAAIFDEDYQALFDLDVFGSLVGMFELNNMGLSIPSPLLPWLGTVSEQEESSAGNASSSTPILTGSKAFIAPHPFLIDHEEALRPVVLLLALST